MRRVSILAALVMSAVAANDALSQKAVISTAGMILRYHGDTIWLERDTTLNRTIFHGDTIFKSMSMNGRLLSSITYVAAGETARVVDVRDSTGKSAPSANMRAVPIAAVTFEQQMLQNELRMQDMRARISGYGIGAELEPPMSSETPRTYAVSGSVSIAQFRDTVRFLRGCPGRQIDTTTYVLYRADSLKRLSAPERMFGQAMAVSVIAQMRMANSRAWMSSRQSPPPADLPHAPDPCATK